MASQSREERRAALEAEMAALDNEPEDDFEVEIYAPSGHGMRLPYSKGKAYAQQHFGIDVDSLQRPGTAGGTRKTAGKAKGNAAENDAQEPGEGDDPNANLRFFDRRAAQRQAGASE